MGQFDHAGALPLVEEEDDGDEGRGERRGEQVEQLQPRVRRVVGHHVRDAQPVELVLHAAGLPCTR